MKIRRGFVSNSSSSSFVFIGRPCSVDALLGGDYEYEVWCQGSYWGEGLDFFELTDKMIDYIREHKEEKRISELDLYEVLTSGDGENGLPLPNMKKNINGWKIYGLKKDYYCTDSVEQFEEKYIKENK